MFNKSAHVSLVCFHCTLPVSASTTGSLRFISTTATGGTVFFQNRTGYRSGIDTAAIQYDVGHVGDDTMTFTPPTVTWLRDGVPVSDTPTNTAGGNGNLSTTLSFMFEESDAGVYQCVFTDTARSEVFVVHPIRLDTHLYTLLAETHSLHIMLQENFGIYGNIPLPP